MWLQKLHTFFSKKFRHICVSLDVNFNESLTNDIVSFEQLGPGNETLVGVNTLFVLYRFTSYPQVTFKPQTLYT